MLFFFFVSIGVIISFFFFFSSRRRHTRCGRDWSSDVCSSDLVGVDGQGRMRPEALRDALRGGSGPTIVCTQVGNVNTGAIDPVGELCQLAHQAGAWVHVDGAFGLWA